jgi:hypothetical protein
MTYSHIPINKRSRNDMWCPQEVTQSAGTMPHEAEVISSNPPSPLLCGHVKKKKKTWLMLSQLKMEIKIKTSNKWQEQY